MALKKPKTSGLRQNVSTASAAMIGYTYFDDPPPGAGGLNPNEYCFAELGTARRTDGGGTGVGNLARALGLPGELPMGARVAFSANGRTITGVKRDRGYGQGGDGIHSDPHYAADFWDGRKHGGKNPLAALGLTGGTGSVHAAYGGPATSNGADLAAIAGGAGAGGSGGSGAGGSGGGSSGGGGSGGGGDILSILGDIVTGNLGDLASKLALAWLGMTREIAVGFFDLIIAPAWHWNQRATAYYSGVVLDLRSVADGSNEFQFGFISTAAFWGLGYVMLFTEPGAKGSTALKPAPVGRSRLAHHTRRAQVLPAKRSLIKPKDVRGHTPKKPKETVSTVPILQVDTMTTTRARTVRVDARNADTANNGANGAGTDAPAGGSQTQAQHAASPAKPDAHNHARAGTSQSSGNDPAPARKDSGS